MNTIKNEFLTNGYTKIDQLFDNTEAEKLLEIYNGVLNDKEKTTHLRSDLAGLDETSKAIERITQIMRPSLVIPKILDHIAYKKALHYAKKLLGDDMELDFDMLINKAPRTNTPTPWHQDAAYWINLPDKRAVSCWIALDNVYESNGCMWFLPVPDQHILKHNNLPNGGALYCDTDTTNAIPVPLQVGGCTFHDGFTLHYSKGNTTNSQRRALILNFRPKEMIKLERNQGIDHTGVRKQRS
ncbi:ectoine hydroxylase-related dioxygenase (phytanoyl-CoA dioxygenase family) [Aquimarina sp. EL_43]|uniref:phytanoyl-CoA dioxygenase family protein n=1 Tax=unclassified Aquimarina TaxID=2627091 RepID=UPI0018CBBD51|nr:MULTISPECIES: phytanoyl-CoA dioxygenase family protein [unclassified Aquimarina]MBG6132609.1 ectoine hydroxylase-related dioxygenase (phytanoyl-CoA dioxygenase family) [Aquimarina sp. EL_35]MBG6152740.1 ectoine hydroxylase-related dioxygenase (phytanoyl-CoA dioxygenase family) [Aquimarina sp. EL_32]MBG6170747.1 ectoine hydroxylase-related dioxygenase (phytanoyl-CoA dioxygenase family) [Aquimarina sp. EL_43]